MEYEKTLYPVIFFQKKLYTGIEYLDQPEYDKPNLFIKGLKIKKHNTSDFTKQIGKEML